MRVAVIGAGPMGLAAALGAIERGHDVVVIERDEPGASLRTWGNTRFFTPLRMNISPAMRRVVGSVDDEALLPGPEFAGILNTIASALGDRVRTKTRVVAVARRGLTRGDYPNHPLRRERPFRLLVESNDREDVIEADAVLDASGGYVLPRHFGAGGLPARGESRFKSRVIRSLGALQKAELAGKRVLLIGHGHSAANAIAHLATTDAQVTWAVRTANRRPVGDIANDPLPERQRVVRKANDLAESVNVERRTTIEAIEENGCFEVAFNGGRRAPFDAIAAFTGYRPDSAHTNELAIETSPVTEGGARLYRAISNITDCLSLPRVRQEDLESGEPNYFFVGSRAYGRAPTFLLQTGLQQLETILDALK